MDYKNNNSPWKIKVIGVGSSGCNSVEYMNKMNMVGIDFIAIDSDKSKLETLDVQNKLHFSQPSSFGDDDELGFNSEFNSEKFITQIKELVINTEIVFICTGIDGATDTTLAPLIARITREFGILTVAVVTEAFNFERRKHIAIKGIDDLAEQVDSLVTLSNDKLLTILGRNFDLGKAFEYENELVFDTVSGITDLVTCPGVINVDFEDLRTVFGEKGKAMVGVGRARGKDRARIATELAISNSMLDEKTVSSSRSLLINITHGFDFKLGDFDTVGDVISRIAAQDALIVVGTSLGERDGEIKITIIATGFDGVGQK